MTDGYTKTVGTVLMMNTVDGINIPEKKLETFQHAEKGSLLLFHVLYKAVNGGVEAMEEINCAYILFKYRTVVTFYTTDIAEKPIQDLEGNSDWNIKFTHGLATFQGWVENLSMTRTTRHVPCFFVPYNLFIN